MNGLRKWKRGIILAGKFWSQFLELAELFRYYRSLLTAGEKSVYRTWFAKNEARCMILVFWGHTSYVAGLYFSILRSKCHPFVSSISPASHQHSLVFYFNFLLQFIDSAVYTFEERFKELVPSTDGMTNGQTAATLMEQAREEVLMVSRFLCSFLY